jgi:hypothetical protein
MPSQRLRVLLDFSHGPDHQLEEVTGAVIANLNGNKNFPHPPIDPATLQTALNEFSASIAVAAQGGPHATAVKAKKRHTLVNLLRQDALYVQANCNDDLETLLSSGFLAANTSRTQSHLAKPVITDLGRGNSGQLVVKVKKIRNAKSYEVHYAPIGTGGAPGTAQTLTGLTNSRSMPINGLTPGTMYTVQVRAAGTTGYSDWSNAVSHMCA